MTRATVLVLVLIIILASGCSGMPEAEDDLAQARRAYVDRQYLEAERLYERYLKAHQDGEARWEVWNRLVEMALAVRNNPHDAIDLLEAMYLEYADDEDKARSILHRLGTLAMENRVLDKAVEVWQRLLTAPDTTSLDHAVAYRNIGEAYIATGDYDLALDALRSCVETDAPPAEHALCLYGLAQTHFFLENYDKAESMLEGVLASSGIEQDLRMIATLLLADVFDHLDMPEKAVSLLQGIRDEYPNPMVVEKRLEYLGQRLGVVVKRTAPVKDSDIERNDPILETEQQHVPESSKDNDPYSGI
ncbi:tetratricopeptide repeat protein [Desulfovibrio psychrotolerans]|uniref:Lipoprotein n=1 Tax=Desulfovibrio psychrotolerans TaxID=415242 RepID=A0A7J0BXV0_9BACT|nr:tetratricopeptide repeat protein [Desulfovibrio psychrotolerans]GFM38527.1 hypothetical protein DSM19430T_32110 [Desulfovibrio psychrotolerans]